MVFSATLPTFGSFRSKVFEIKASEVWRLSYFDIAKWAERHMNLKKKLQSLNSHNLNLSKCIKLKFLEDIQYGALICLQFFKITVDINF